MGIKHYQENEDASEAVKLMKLNFDDHCSNSGDPVPIDSDTYVNIMSKILDQILYEAYLQIHYPERRKRETSQERQGMNTIQEESSNNNDTSRIFMQSSHRSRNAKQGQSPRDRGVNRGQDGSQAANDPAYPWKLKSIVKGINFGEVIRSVFDLFNINYHDVDFDCDLVLSKLRFVFTEAPPKTAEQNHVKLEIECLLEGHKHAMECI